MKMLSLAGAALFAVSAHATLINFDDLAANTIVTNQYAGVTFSSVGGATNRAYPFSGASSLPNILCTANANGAVDCLGLVQLDFANPVNNLKFMAIEPNAVGTAIVAAIYQNGVFSANENIAGVGGAGNKLVDLSAYTNVTRLELRVHPDEIPNQGVGYDDFSFNVVPEPGTYAALGLGAAVLLRRRARR